MFKRLFFASLMVLAGFAPAAESAILLDKVVAIVNKDVITWSELYKAMEFEATDAVKAMQEDQRRKFFRENEMAFLETLVDKRLQLQEAAAAGITVTDKDLVSAIESTKKKYSLTDEKFREALKKEGFTLEAYKKNLSEQIILGRLVEHDVKMNIIATEGDIDKYLKEHPGAEKDNEGYNLSHIFLRQTDNRKQLEEKAADICKKLKEGASFPETAALYSEDSNARNGGALGFIKKTDLDKDFLRVLSNMKEGEISEYFRSGNGIHILRVNEAAIFKNRQELREAVRQKLMERMFKTLYSDWMKGLREKGYIEIKL